MARGPKRDTSRDENIRAMYEAGNCNGVSFRGYFATAGEAAAAYRQFHLEQRGLLARAVSFVDSVA